MARRTRFANLLKCRCIRISRRPQRQLLKETVAVSFWLLAPYVAAESIRDLVTGHHAGATVIGIALTAVALLVMPLLGRAKRKLAAVLGSAATAGEGTQNYLCAAQAGLCWLGWPSPPPGPAGGGSTPSSGWPSPRRQCGKASDPGPAATAADRNTFLTGIRPASYRYERPGYCDARTEPSLRPVVRGV
jgi:hypothetical protein